MIKLCGPATIRSKFSSYWHFWHKSASIDGTINISRPSISLDYKSEKKQILVQISKKTKTNFSHEITSGSSSSIPLTIDYTRRGTSIEGYVLSLIFTLHDPQSSNITTAAGECMEYVKEVNRKMSSRAEVPSDQVVFNRSPCWSMRCGPRVEKWMYPSSHHV